MVTMCDNVCIMMTEYVMAMVTKCIMLAEIIMVTECIMITEYHDDKVYHGECVSW